MLAAAAVATRAHWGPTGFARLVLALAVLPGACCLPILRHSATCRVRLLTGGGCKPDTQEALRQQHKQRLSA